MVPRADVIRTCREDLCGADLWPAAPGRSGTWHHGRIAKACRLAELRAGDLAVQPVLERDYTCLDAEQARAFRLLSSSTSPFMPLSQSATLLDRDLAQTEDCWKGGVASCAGSAVCGTEWGWAPYPAVTDDGCVRRTHHRKWADGEQLLPRCGRGRCGRSASVPVSLWLMRVSFSRPPAARRPPPQGP